jgi:hypothetical protein
MSRVSVVVVVVVVEVNGAAVHDRGLYGAVRVYIDGCRSFVSLRPPSPSQVVILTPDAPCTAPCVAGIHTSYVTFPMRERADEV